MNKGKNTMKKKTKKNELSKDDLMKKKC